MENHHRPLSYFYPISQEGLIIRMLMAGEAEFGTRPVLTIEPAHLRMGRTSRPCTICRFPYLQINLQRKGHPGGREGGEGRGLR